METLYVQVSYQGLSVPLQISDYEDLERQIRLGFVGLPREIRLVARGMYGEMQVDSQYTLQRLPRSAPVLITIREAFPRRTVTRNRAGTVNRVRLANLAYLNRQREQTEQVPVEADVPVEELCPICMERWTQPMKAKCGHVCCLTCWQRALAQYLECPLCRSHVRLKTLRPVPCSSS